MYEIIGFFEIVDFFLARIDHLFVKSTLFEQKIRISNWKKGAQFRFQQYFLCIA